MKKYKLIKEYPGSPPLNTIAEPSGDVKYTYPNNEEHFESSSSGNLFKKLIENQPEFWQEVVEKDYQILQLALVVLYNHRITDVSENSDMYINSLLACKGNYIHSVKRLSDGEVFTVGNEVYQDKVIHNNSFKISSFNFSRVTGDLLAFGGNGGISISKIKIKKQPLFTTEDGVDIYPEDRISTVLLEKMELYSINNTAGENTSPVEGFKYFSTKEAAEEYILMNKPCLSIQDVLNGYTWDNYSIIGSINKTVESLKELVKERL